LATLEGFDGKLLLTSVTSALQQCQYHIL